MKTCGILIFITTLSAVSSAAQSNIDAANKFAWCENISWTNWRDAGSPAGSQGVIVHASFLSGFIWAENAGWINVGDGTPGSICGGQPCYANLNGADFGVNRDAGTGDLSGYGWGENFGWINFGGGAAANPPNPARLDGGACRFRGFVWAENVGWINLDHATHYVAPTAVVCACEPCDTNCDGSVNIFDIQWFVDALAPSPPPGCSHCAADVNADGSVNQFDIQGFVECLGG